MSRNQHNSQRTNTQTGRFSYRLVEKDYMRADARSPYPNDWWWCTGKTDHSGHHLASTGLGLPCPSCTNDDSSDCSWCYLGYGHTCNEHVRSLEFMKKQRAA